VSFGLLPSVKKARL